MDLNLGFYVKNTRVFNNLSLRELADKSGISFSHLSKIERGEHIPSKENIYALAKTLDISEYDLLLLAGYSSEADMNFWKGVFDKIDPSWNFNKDEYKNEDGTANILKFRNEAVHGLLKFNDSRLKDLITEHSIEIRSKGLKRTRGFNTEVEISHDEYVQYLEWKETIQKLEDKSISPKDLKEIIVFLQRFQLLLETDKAWELAKLLRGMGM